MKFILSKGKSVFLLAVIAVAASLILFYSDQGLNGLKSVEKEKQRMLDQNKALSEENQRLVRNIQRIKSDPRVIEDEARKKLGLIKPNEVIFRMDD